MDRQGRMTIVNAAGLDVDRIEAAREGCVVGGKVVVFKTTASTNDIAWAYAGNSAHHGLCVLAEQQTAGRGRRGRLWHSRPGESLLCSVLLIDTPIEAELLTLAAAVATAEAVCSFCGVNAGIKWPNDILVKGNKLAGILVEKRTIGRRVCFVVGIGINCNQTAQALADGRLRSPATSLRIETGTLVDRTALTCTLMAALEEWLDRALAGLASPVNPVIERWAQLSTLLGQHITVECDNRTFSGFCRGIDPADGLIVQLDAGAIRTFAAPHTSIVRTGQSNDINPL